MAYKMNPEIKVLWMADLRSGKHKQAKRVLNSEEGFCCLGRLTDLFIASPANTEKLQWSTSTAGEFYEDGRKDFGNSFGVLSKEVMDWAGLRHTTGGDIRINPYSSPISLAEANDKGLTFFEIADLIEAQL